MNPSAVSYLVAFLAPATFAQQQGQFTTELSALQNNNQNLTAYYIATASTYHVPLNQSWTVQVTDKNATNSTIGQLTASWNGQTRVLSILNGIVSTGFSPTYAVTIPHSEFMSFSQTVLTRNTAAAVADYSEYYLSGNLKYTRVN
jgi:predicted PurR-regulated permease PerM